MSLLSYNPNKIDIQKIQNSGMLQIHKTASAINIRLKWFCAFHQVQIVRMVVFYGFISVFYYLNEDMQNSGFPLWGYLLVITVFIPFDLVRVIYGFINTSVISLDKREFSVSFSPLPAPGAKRFPSDQIAKLKVLPTHLVSGTRTKRVTSVYFYLVIEDKKGQDHRVISTKFAMGEEQSLNLIAEELANFLQVPFVPYRKEG
jgi:hypothetical protein